MSYLTAGAAGMFCGSCMHDNTLVRALRSAGVQAVLVPTYTPIRTDDREDVSDSHVFLGGIHVYLNQRLPWFRFLPRYLTRWMDRPAVLRWATRRGISISPAELGELTLSMLAGGDGVQAAEFQRLTDWLATDIRPRLIHLTNLLIGGGIRQLKERLSVPVFVTLQGDDLFLNGLVPPHRDRAWRQVAELVPLVDQFICFSQDYASYMQEMLAIPPDKITVVPLGIDGQVIAEAARGDASKSSLPRRVGYLARLAPEKGLHVAVEAFEILKRQPEFHDVELHVAGWCGKDQRDYAQQQWSKLHAAQLGQAYSYHGSLDLAEKGQFLRQLDLFSVPATFREPKGIYVLEAMAAGVPVVQPHIGSFPELIQATGGGFLVPPNDAGALAQKWADVLRLPDRGRSVGETGQEHVLQLFGLAALGRALREAYARVGVA